MRASMPPAKYSTRSSKVGYDGGLGMTDEERSVRRKKQLVRKAEPPSCVCERHISRTNRVVL
jgi:hypothetical protein